MFRNTIGMSLAVMALLGEIDATQLNQHLKNKRCAEEELENDNGDDYMTQSIAEAEKEVKNKGGSIDMQKEIKQLEEESVVKVVKIEDTPGNS